MTNKPKQIALVIGSGGVKCAASIGMLRVLQKENIQVNRVIGCSGGSLYGALIANHTDLGQMEEWSRVLWTSEVMQGYVENLKASKDGTLRFNERSGMVNDAVMNRNLEQVYGDLEFSDLEIPFKVVATDFLNGDKVTLSTGRIFDAIRASLAIPIILPPWEVNGRLLIDGAVSNPLPIDVAIQDGADIIIAMGFTLDYRSRFRSMTAVQEQLNSIYMNNILTATYSFYNLAHHAEIFPIIPEFSGPLSMFDTDRIPEIIEVGEQAARQQLPYIQRLLASA